MMSHYIWCYMMPPTLDNVTGGFHCSCFDRASWCFWICVRHMFREYKIVYLCCTRSMQFRYSTFLNVCLRGKIKCCICAVPNPSSLGTALFLVFLCFHSWGDVWLYFLAGESAARDWTSLTSKKAQRKVPYLNWMDLVQHKYSIWPCPKISLTQIQKHQPTPSKEEQ